MRSSTDGECGTPPCAAVRRIAEHLRAIDANNSLSLQPLFNRGFARFFMFVDNGEK